MKRILAIVFILALAGGYWFMQNRDRFFPKPVATEVAPQRWQVSTTRQEQVVAVQIPVNATRVAPSRTATQPATQQEMQPCPGPRRRRGAP